jgi:hypothetical protein
MLTYAKLVSLENSLEFKIGKFTSAILRSSHSQKSEVWKIFKCLENGKFTSAQIQKFTSIDW